MESDTEKKDAADTDSSILLLSVKRNIDPKQDGVIRCEKCGKYKTTGKGYVRSEGGSLRQATFFSLDHTSEVFQESLDLKDDVWDCTLIKFMKSQNDTVVNPIYEWSDRDVWEYIRQEGIKVNPLYERGWKRVGCIGCPLSSYTEKTRCFKEYPTYKANYIKAMDRMLLKMNAEGRRRFGWNTGKDVYDWWIEKYKHEIKGQMSIFDYEDKEE